MEWFQVFLSMDIIIYCMFILFNRPYSKIMGFIHVLWEVFFFFRAVPPYHSRYLGIAVLKKMKSPVYRIVLPAKIT